MECTVRCYKYTGLNAVNLPDGPDYFTNNNISYTDYTGFDFVDPFHLDRVKIKMTRQSGAAALSMVSDIDYCAIITSNSQPIYYVVSDFALTSPDVAILSLVPDYLTTLGGAKNLQYLDGITERYCTESDELFEYTQDDEYMTPMQPLQLTTQWINDYAGATTLVESTIDLINLASQFDSEGHFTGDGILFVDPTTTVTEEKTVIYDSDGKKSGSQVTEKPSERTVTPYIQGVAVNTKYYGSTGSSSAPGTCLYDASNANIQKALGIVRALSRESAIISQTNFPSVLDIRTSTNGQVTEIYDSPVTNSTNLKFDKYGSEYNQAINCGKYNSIGLMTVAGEKSEFYPEQVYHSGDTTLTIRSECDPRPGGKPYFRPQYYMGLSAGGASSFMIGSVSGLEWQSAPLVYTAPSGSYMSKISYSTSAAAAAVNYGSGQQNIKNAMYYNDDRNGNAIASNIIGAVGNLAKTLTGDTSGANGLYGMLNTQSSYEETRLGNQNSLLKNELSYSIARQQELNEYAWSQAIVTPEVVVPFDANYLRDFAGNGVLVYQYSYSHDDAQRIDRLLTMYGYKASTAVSKKIFTTRKYFNYVRAHGVSIDSGAGTGYVKIRQMREGAAAQLSVGARFWHVKPSISYLQRGDKNPIA